MNVKRVKPFACILGLLLATETFAQRSADSLAHPGLASFSYYYGGLVKSEEGDLNGAIAAFNHLIELNPGDEIAYYNRGLLEANKRDFDRAIADLNHAIQLSPKFARAYSDRGSIKATRGDIEGAIADFNRAIQLSPQFGQAYINLGSVKANGGDLDEAIADFNRAVRLDPDSVEAFENLGSAKAKKGDLEGAIADYNQAIELNPKDFGAFEKRALTKQLKGDFEGALSDLIRCVEVAPPGESRDYAQYSSWLIRVRRGQTAEANRELAAYLGNRRGTTEVDWVSKIGSFLLDQISESDFLAGATSSDIEKDRAQHCEAWYYAGMKRLLAGYKQTAADCFNKCLGTQENSFDEYMLAQAELKSLGTRN
jgi:tetratricopeptide (TPR) repeat protein